MCSHLLAAAYFAESIITKTKFYGIYCQSYFLYLFGFCYDEIENELDIPRLGVMGEYSYKS